MNPSIAKDMVLALVFGDGMVVVDVGVFLDYRRERAAFRRTTSGSFNKFTKGIG